MPLYYFHLRNGEDVLLDPDGRELGSLREVESATLEGARSIISDDALAGAIELAYRIEVENASGSIVHTLQFRDAVEISGG